MDDGNGLAEALLGVDGFRVLTVAEDVELVVDRDRARLGRLRRLRGCGPSRTTDGR